MPRRRKEREEMLRLVCDRCGVTAKEGNPGGWKCVCVHNTRCGNFINSVSDESYHLCQECVDKFNRFMKFDVELWGKDALSQLPDWVEKVLEAYPTIWFEDNMPLFSPQSVKTALQIAIVTMGDEKK